MGNTKLILEYFSLTELDLEQIIDKMLENKQEGDFGPIPQNAQPFHEADAIKQLHSLIKMLKNIFNSEMELNEWMTTPNRELLNTKPIDVIKIGKAFRLIQHWIRIGEGIT